MYSWNLSAFAEENFFFNKPYVQVATIAKCLSGFRATEIYSLNRSPFSEEDFVTVNI
jgi:hypothetical protein